MEIIELTADNIGQYLDDCVTVQKFLVKPDEVVEVEQIKATAIAGNNYFIGLLEDEKIVGLGVINKLIEPVRTIAYVDNIVVHEDYRGRGLFTILMDELEAKAKEWGAAGTKLTCSRSEVQPLYEKRNYKELSTKCYIKKF